MNVMDFFELPESESFATIIGNPPYVRYQDIAAETRRRARHSVLDGRANLYLFFIEKCLRHLAPGGELVFITPFVHPCTHYDGAVMAIFPRDPAVDVRLLAAALNAVDWADLGFVCDGRFLFTQRSLEQTPLPESCRVFLPGDGVRSQADLPRQQLSPSIL